MKLAGFDDPALGTFNLENGQLGVLLGRSGAGKTVLVRKLLRLDRPLTARRRGPLSEVCAFVPQSDGVFFDLSVLENITCPDPHVSTVAVDEAVEWLDLVGLGPRARSAVTDLSPAERRRVALARALSRRRPLLIIDGVLDRTLDGLLTDLLSTVPHLCSVLTTSCVADTRTWEADNVGLVEGGRVIASGRMTDLVQALEPGVRGALNWTLS